ncbi:MAG: MerR family transcriptional regulator [Desulfomonile tiedjei]|nr:MerR family transcriptional regulator [Desulfomonile tiedjei]
MRRELRATATGKKAKEALLTENEFYDATGLEARQRKKYEKEGYIKPARISNGDRYYSVESVHLVKAMRKFADTGLPLVDAYQMAAAGVLQKKRVSSNGDSGQQGVIEPRQIKTHPTFEGLLPIDPALLKLITADMAANGYDDANPVVLGIWKGLDHPVLIDGYARRQAAIDAGIQQISCVVREFENSAAAMEYAMGKQARRRITNDAVRFRLIETYDSLMERGRRSEDSKELPTRVGNFMGRSASAHKTAAMVACNYKKVERARRILKDGTAQIKEDVRRGKLTINRAYNLIVKGAKDEAKKAREAKRRAAKLLLNDENLTRLQAIDGSLEDHINAAVETYLRRLGRKKGRMQSRAGGRPEAEFLC